MIEVKEEWDLLKSQQDDPLRTFDCIKCGINGLHACTGRKLPAPTPEQEAKLRRAFGQEST